jgi:hypothetical protein
MNKFSKFSQNRTKILSQIEMSFLGGEGKGRVGGGSKYFLKIPYVIVNNMSKFSENRMCRFFLNPRGAKFPFFIPGAALGAVGRFFKSLCCWGVDLKHTLQFWLRLDQPFSRKRHSCTVPPPPPLPLHPYKFVRTHSEL